MWKPEKDNQILSGGVSQIEGQHKKYGIQCNIKILPGRDCEMVKVMWFLKYIEIFEVI